MGAWPSGLSCLFALMESRVLSKNRSRPTRLPRPLHRTRPNMRTQPRKGTAPSPHKSVRHRRGSWYVLRAGEVRRIVKHHDGPSFAPFIRPVVNHRRLDFDALHQVQQPRHAAHEGVFAGASALWGVHHIPSAARKAAATITRDVAPNSTTCITRCLKQTAWLLYESS